MSAWIEINARLLGKRISLVALYMSAWIEMSPNLTPSLRLLRRTLHECVD